MPPRVTGTLPPTAAPFVGGRRLTLRVARFGDEGTARYEQELYADFGRQYRDIALTVYPVEANDWPAYLDRLTAQIGTPEAPDAAFVATEATQVLAGRGQIAPLDPFVLRDRDALREYFADVAPVLVEAMMYEGRLYELPSDFNAPMLFFHTGVLRERGVQPFGIAPTKDEFAAALPRLTDRNTEPPLFGFAWTNRLFGGALPWFAANGGNILSTEKFPGGDWLWGTFYANDRAAVGRQGGYRFAQAMANSAANVEALQFLVDLTNRLRIAPPPAAADSLQNQVIARFGRRRLATFVSGAFSVSQIKGAGIPSQDYEVAQFPRWKYARPVFGAGGYVMMEASPNKDAVWEFLKFRVRRETIAATVKGGSTTPARRSLANDQLWTAEYGPGNWKAFYDTLDTYPEAAPMPCPPQANEITASFTRGIDRAMAGRVSPMDALATMEREIGVALRRRP